MTKNCVKYHAWVYGGIGKISFDLVVCDFSYNLGQPSILAGFQLRPEELLSATRATFVTMIALAIFFSFWPVIVIKTGTNWSNKFSRF